VTSGTVALSRTRRRRRLRLGRAEPLVWIAPAVAVVVFVFGYSMFELVKTSFRFDGSWTTENFRITWSDPTFRTALAHNARLLIDARVPDETVYLFERRLQTPPAHHSARQAREAHAMTAQRSCHHCTQNAASCCVDRR